MKKHNSFSEHKTAQTNTPLAIWTLARYNSNCFKYCVAQIFGYIVLQYHWGLLGNRWYRDLGHNEAILKSCL